MLETLIHWLHPAGEGLIIGCGVVGLFMGIERLCRRFVIADAPSQPGRIYDTAGNVAALTCNQCHTAVSGSDELTKLGRCWDCYNNEYDALISRMRAATTTPDHTDIVVNALSPIGFVVVSVRPIGAYATETAAADVARIVDVAVENMKKALTPCAGCAQLDGVHKADCVEVAALTDMGCDAMMGVEAADAGRYGDACADCGSSADTVCPSDCTAKGTR